MPSRHEWPRFWRSRAPCETTLHTSCLLLKTLTWKSFSTGHTPKYILFCKIHKWSGAKDRFCKWGSWQTYPKKKQKYSTIFKILIRENGGGGSLWRTWNFLNFPKILHASTKKLWTNSLKLMFSICRKCLLPEKAPTPTPDVTCLVIKSIIIVLVLETSIKVTLDNLWPTE